MSVAGHLNRNLHHAYLIEGVREEVMPEILLSLENFGVKTVGNPDFIKITVDSFKIEDARNLRDWSLEKPVTGRKVFLISTNSFLLEAQNTLLKMFEEPVENTHFFIIMPDANVLLKTLLSRFYFIKTEKEENLRAAESFIKMGLPGRLEFVKELLIDSLDEDRTEDSVRSKAIQFLNAVEACLHKSFVEDSTGLAQSFHQIFKVREFLRMPGSSAKSLMESVALSIPE